MILPRAKSGHLHYFLIVSLAIHAALIATWQIDGPGPVIEPGNTLAVVLQTNSASEAADDVSSVQKGSAQISRHKQSMNLTTSTSKLSSRSAKTFLPSPVGDALPAPAEQTSAPDSSETTASSDPTIHRHTAEPQIEQQLRHALIQYFSYPRLARKHGWEGTVGLGVHITADGKLSRIHVARSSGYGVLDRAALTSLQQVTAIPEATTWLGKHDLEIIFPVEYHLIDG